MQVIPDLDDGVIRNTAFEWSILEFKSKEMKLKLVFEKPSDISIGAYPDTLQIKIYQTTLFIRESDGALITDTLLTSDLIKQIDPNADLKFIENANTVSGASKGTIAITIVMNKLVKFYLNTVLSMVRSISMIVHMMTVPMDTPSKTDIFFNTVFDLISFDIIPTEDLYNKIFEFDNVPLTEYFLAVGYESQHIIFNMGSIFLFLVIEVFIEITFALIAWLCKKPKVKNWAKKKLDSFFFVGLISFYNEIYICMAFSAAINLFDY